MFSEETNKIIIPPLKDQGWDTKYSTVPPWLQIALPLIDALTGAPGTSFPMLGSKVVSALQGCRAVAPKPAPLWAAYKGDVSFSQPLIRKI
jgi:hypothetical protein